MSGCTTFSSEDHIAGSVEDLTETFALNVQNESYLQPSGHALVLDVGGGDRVKVSIEDFVAFVLREQEVIAVGESDPCSSHGYLRRYH
jgi:hypothetical protein